MKMEPLADLIAADVNVDLTEEQVFVYSMPHDIEVGCVFLGKIYGTEVDHYLPGYRDTSFQVIVRHSDVGSGMAIMEQINTALTMMNTQLPGMLVKDIRPSHDPVVFPFSKGDFLEISTNFMAIYVLTG